VHVSVDVAGDEVRVTAWKAQIGRVRLYFLDTAVEGNSPAGAAITDRLYGGDAEHRIRQEIVLGVAGVRMLRALGLDPQVFHTNEGHAGFLSLERIRELVGDGLTFGAAVEAVRAGGVFTTHTPVPAGIDRFPVEMMEKYFAAFAASCGISFRELMQLGYRPDEPHETRFNMAVMGLRLAGRANGVAQLHGAVSRSMFKGLWPDVPEYEVPITAITNGVHAHTWVSDDVDALFRSSVGGMWDGADRSAWDHVDEIPPAAVWAARARGRADLVAFVRDRLGDAVLDPNALTIGFARRFATYKRATLLLSQPERLRRLLLSADRPVQFVFAGKAHPADQPGKDMIRDIELFARQLDVGHRFVFVPDYDMAVARVMYHGCDVWLNNPRRPLEACGTSGMKAALNGALNCSILDGWWDECYDGKNGWAIMSADDDADTARRDAREATSLFGLLEREIVPLFYARADLAVPGVPVGWVDKMKDNWRSLGPFVTAARWSATTSRSCTSPLPPAGSQPSRTTTRPPGSWLPGRTRCARTGPECASVRSRRRTATRTRVTVRAVCAQVELAGLQPADLLVQVMHGGVDREGAFVGEPAVVALHHVGGSRFEGHFVVGEAGPYGFTVRAVPSNPRLTSPVELGVVAWAS
jgi:starch phosphorylase